MEAAAAKEWFLRKQEDGTIFGPLSFELLSRWASAAQVAPNDVVSNDQQAWIKAPMVPELGMDWLVELTSERYYGPTTLGAIQEFIRLGEINAETFIINSCDGVRKKICDFPMLLQTSQEPGSGGQRNHGYTCTTGGRNLDQRRRTNSRIGTNFTRRTPCLAGSGSALS